jgi:hypothetical protein
VDVGLGEIAMGIMEAVSLILLFLRNAFVNVIFELM